MRVELSNTSAIDASKMSVVGPSAGCTNHPMPIGTPAQYGRLILALTEHTGRVCASALHTIARIAVTANTIAGFTSAPNAKASITVINPIYDRHESSSVSLS
jgi:hypothetical protein